MSKSLKVRVSHPFAEFVNMSAKMRGYHATAKVVTIPEKWYKFQTGTDPDDALFCGDYTAKGIRAIEISYPANYDACNKYLTTDKLRRIFRSLPEKTADALADMLEELIAI